VFVHSYKYPLLYPKLSELDHKFYRTVAVDFLMTVIYFRKTERLKKKLLRENGSGRDLCSSLEQMGRIRSFPKLYNSHKQEVANLMEMQKENWV
ncbi:unnamed protein product, partial [Larinioides sclopetarius]